MSERRKARAARPPHVSTGLEFNHFPWEASGLGADKLVRRQNIVAIAFHYNKTVSLSYKTNKVPFKDIVSHIIYRVATIQGLLTLGRAGLSDQRVT